MKTEKKKTDDIIERVNRQTVCVPTLELLTVLHYASVKGSESADPDDRVLKAVELLLNHIGVI